jgi:hypothetical protein
MNIDFENDAAGKQHGDAAAVGDDLLVIVEERLDIQWPGADGGDGLRVAEGGGDAANRLWSRRRGGECCYRAGTQNNHRHQTA